MLTFNNDHIFIGYLKQLLHSFNLPKFRVYTKEDQNFRDTYGYEAPDIIKTIDSGNYVRFVHYIKDGKIKHYIYEDDRWDDCALKHFEYDTPIRNWTKHLEIRNNIYDTYTHEYLGDYLRFLRDYNGIDLMSMYNCFSNKICSNVDYTNVTGENGSGSIPGFTSSDNNYKIFMFPVKLFKHYTIAIDCPTTVEICCGIFGKYQDNRDRFKNIPKMTYKKYNNLMFLDPILYTELDNLTAYINDESKTETLDDQTLVELANNECNLKMFIKLPKNNSSSITVLEGDYRHYNDSMYKLQNWTDTKGVVDSVSFTKQLNHTITNYENLDKNTDIFKPISALQLLQYNTKVSYPFSDRLIEYLIGNAITPLDYSVDNTIRVQTVINDGTKPDGRFTEKIRRQLYDFMMQPHNNNKLNALIHNIDNSHDILGYVDKDVEKYFHTVTTDSNGETKVLALNNINIYDIGGE